MYSTYFASIDFCKGYSPLPKNKYIQYIAKKKLFEWLGSGSGSIVIVHMNNGGVDWTGH